MSSRFALVPLVLAALAAAFVLSYSALSAASVKSAAAAPQTPTTLAAALPAAPTPVPKPNPGPRWRSAVVRRSVPLRVRPNGHVVTRVGTSTEFGSARVMSIAAQRGPWLGVVTTEMPNGKLAWVHRKAGLRLRRGAYSLHADLSDRRLELRRDRRVLSQISVAIGRPGSETPTGRFAVTDKLRGGSYGPYYGCCILALSGHQPNTPAGWRGGNRLAAHGAPGGGVGGAASAGCLRASDSDLRVLMRRVPVGAPVFVSR
jgi:lipoprotein-anchoring transpeptidase ErfK/SrfK